MVPFDAKTDPPQGEAAKGPASNLESDDAANNSNAMLIKDKGPSDAIPAAADGNGDMAFPDEND